MTGRPGRWSRAIGIGFLSMTLAGCVASPLSDPAGDGDSSARRGFPLDQLKTATIGANGATVRVWLASTPAQQQEGLMFVREEEIADDQGMLFVFPDEELRGFWMRNTITPLDIAFARMDGTIVAVHTMPPLTLESFPSIEPAMFALEMKAGAFAKLGVAEGARLDIPAEILKP